MVQRYKKSVRYARKIANNLVKGSIRSNNAAKGVLRNIYVCVFQKK